METIKEIIEDVLLELYGEVSKRPVGAGMPKEIYVRERLEQAQAKLCEEKGLKELTQQRNKLNREIAVLKKANLEPKPNLNKDGEETELATCCYCGELFDSTGESSCGNCN